MFLPKGVIEEEPNEVVLQTDTRAVRILPVFQDSRTPATNMDIVLLDLKK